MTSAGLSVVVLDGPDPGVELLARQGGEDAGEAADVAAEPVQVLAAGADVNPGFRSS